jgi:hypothetical protein
MRLAFQLLFVVAILAVGALAIIAGGIIHHD